MWKRKTSWKRPRRWTKRGPSTAKLQRSKAPRRFNWVSIADDQCCATLLEPRQCKEVVEGEEQDTFCFQSPSVVDCATGVVQTLDAEPRRFAIVVPNTPDLGGSGGSALYQSDDITLVKLVGHITLQPFWVFNEEGLGQLNSVAANMVQATSAALQAQRHYYFRAGLHKDAWLFDTITGTYTPPIHDPWQTDQWTDGRFLKQWSFEKMPGQLSGQVANFLAATDKIGAVANVSGGNSTNVLTDGSGTINTEVSSVISSVTRGDPQSINGVYLPPVSPIRLNLTSRRRLRFRESEGLVLWMNYGTIDYREAIDSTCFSGLNFLAVGFVARAHVKALIETA